MLQTTMEAFEASLGEAQSIGWKLGTPQVAGPLDLPSMPEVASKPTEQQAGISTHGNEIVVNEFTPAVMALDAAALVDTGDELDWSTELN